MNAILHHGIVNFMPHTSLEIMKCLRNGQLEEATKIVEKETLAIFDLRVKQPGYSTSVIKEAMNLCGIRVGPVRPPLPSLLEADRVHLRVILHSRGVIN